MPKSRPPPACSARPPGAVPSGPALPRAGATLLAAALLQACVMVPVMVQRYDVECRVVARHMRLEAIHLGTLQGCSDKACATLLAAVGVTAAASAVISGSIAVVGNVVYWLERRGHCLLAGEPLPPPVVPQQSTGSD